MAQQYYPDGINWQIDIPNIPVYQMLEETAANHPDAPAFDFLGKKYTWGEINDLSNHFARGLQDLGLEKGDKVGLMLPNCPYFLISYYGILKAGGTAVNYNPLYADSEVQHLITDSQTKIMVTADLAQTYPKAECMIGRTKLHKIVSVKFTDMLPFPKSMLFPLIKGKDIASIDFSATHNIDAGAMMDNDGNPMPFAIDPENDVAVLQYTGGTTGVPKGAMLTHRNVVANTCQIEEWFKNLETAQHKMVGVLPFFHVFAMSAVMNISVRKAMEIIALPRFELDQTLDLIAKKKPTIFPAVPAIYTAINNHKKRGNYDLSSIQYCISGGAPLPVEVRKDFEEATGCVLVEGYGLTESSPVATINPLEGARPDGKIGLPVPLTEISLRNPETGENVAVGEKGELCIKGPQVMKGYWGDLGKDADTYTADGYLRTGDVAVMDENGFYAIVDRIKDLIITNGYNVYPRHVEEAIYKHPSVEECIVGGVPDNNRGEIVKVWIKRKDGMGLSEKGLREFLEDKLSKIEMPRQIEFRDTPLPKTMIGKLSRKDIIAEDMEKRAGGGSNGSKPDSPTPKP